MILALLALTSTTVRVEAAVAEGKLHERFWVRHESRWAEIALDNGFTQGSLSIKGPGGEVKIDSPYYWQRKRVMAFHRTNANQEYRVSVNRNAAGSFAGKQLEIGIRIAVPN